MGRLNGPNGSPIVEPGAWGIAFGRMSLINPPIRFSSPRDRMTKPMACTDRSIRIRHRTRERTRVWVQARARARGQAWACSADRALRRCSLRCQDRTNCTGSASARAFGSFGSFGSFILLFYRKWVKGRLRCRGKHADHCDGPAWRKACRRTGAALLPRTESRARLATRLHRTMLNEFYRVTRVIQGKFARPDVLLEPGALLNKQMHGSMRRCLGLGMSRRSV
jgi:hypothetical protein